MRRWLAIWLLCLTTAAAAQDRPRVGLALGGGGARGLAHIGVLRWLEEHRIPVDYVAGTSFGGLVGGLYAAGMSIDEMTRLAGDVDWQALLRDEQPYADLAYRRKEDARDYPGGLALGLRGGLRLPAGLNQGHGISLMLSRLTAPIGPLASFDELCLPFRCVATDLERGEEVVLRDGSLAEAIRATMAIPGAFAPVELNGRVLADGGILNNVPTDVVKAMGAEIVIAVDVGTKLADRESLESLTGIVGQSISVMILQNVRERLRLADVVLAPDLAGVGTLGFGDIPAIIEAGYRHAAAKERLLAGLALPEEAWRAYLSERAARRRGGAFVPSFIDVEGPAQMPLEPFEERLAGLAGAPLEAAELESRLASLYGEGLYSRFGYAPVERDGLTGLRLRVTETRHGPPFLHLGLSVSGRGADAPDFTVHGRIAAMGLTGYGSEWRSDLSLGARQALTSEYYQPLGGAWSFSPSIYLQRTTSNLFAGERRTAEYRVDDLGLGLDLVATGRRDELRLGLLWNYYAAAVRVGDPVQPSTHETLGAMAFRYRHEGLDQVQIPSRGVRSEVAGRFGLQALGSDSGRPRVTASWLGFRPVGAGVMHLGLAGGTTLDQTAPTHAQFTLGGLLRLSGYDEERFRGSHYVLGRLGYLHPVWRLPAVAGGPVYAGGWYEFGSAFERWDRATYYSSVSLGAAAETILGPAFIGWSFGEGGDGGLLFSLGSLF